MRYLLVFFGRKLALANFPGVTPMILEKLLPNAGWS